MLPPSRLTFSILTDISGKVKRFFRLIGKIFLIPRLFLPDKSVKYEKTGTKNFLNFLKVNKMKESPNDRLKKLRKILNLKQRELAERLGVSVGVVGDFECGRAAIPRARIYQICKEFRVNRAWLVDGVGEMFEPEPEPIDVRDAQRRFVLNCFRALPQETQEIFLDALKNYVDETTPEKARAETETERENVETLVAQNESESDGATA